jgi:hypothetical protein
MSKIDTALTTDRQFDRREQERAAGECCQQACEVGWLGDEEKAIVEAVMGERLRFVTSRHVF